MRYQPKIETWEKFMRGEQIKASEVRPEILESWIRCSGKIDPYKKKDTEVLSPGELKALKQKNKELIDISLPVMERLYKFVTDTVFSVILFVVDRGRLVIVEHLGDDVAIKQSHNVGGYLGSDWSEDAMGTHSCNIALYHNKPFQIYPLENYCRCLHDGSTSSAPIRDPDTQKIIGVLTSVTDYHGVHLHTLGMIVAAVDSIEKQISITRSKNKAEIESHYRKIIMESISSSLIAIDKYNNVTHINQNAVNMFSIKENIIGKNIYSALSIKFGTLKKSHPLINAIKSNEDINNEFVQIHIPSGIIRCTMTVRSLEYNEIIGRILIFEEMARVNELVTRTYGNYARFTFNDFVGEDKKFIKCLETGIQVSKGNSNILLLGESGTGKDIFAQSIHNESHRSSKPYIAINCAAIPRDLLGSELFGYVEGAFTGARKGGNPGKFELADGGTIFLDEIGEMPLEMQTALLRVLEERTVTRIGGKSAIPIDVRIIAATNRDLSKEVEKGNFRKDLFYRLNVISIYMPQLKERRGDIPILINHFAHKMSQQMGVIIKDIDHNYLLACSIYDWPGNIRELQNTVERCLNLINNNRLDINVLPDHIIQNAVEINKQKEANYKNLRGYSKVVEYSLIQSYLKEYDGNMSLVAKELGIARSTLYRKIAKHNI